MTPQRRPPTLPTPRTPRRRQTRLHRSRRLPRKPRRRETASCPQCGGEFPAGRLACPHCGSDAQTGWSENDASDWSYSDEDYDEFVEEMKGRDAYHSDPKWRRRRLVVRIVGLIVVVALLVLIFGALQYL